MNVRPVTTCPHEPRCNGLFSECVTAWLEGPAVGTPESLRLGYLAHKALACPGRFCHVHGCEVAP